MSPSEDKLRRVSRAWEAFGRRDPMWAVLTEPSKRGRKWDPVEFFATGETEIAALESLLSSLGRSPGRRLAVDFGCGVGRVTRALAGRFDRVVGIDVAESMISEAQRLNSELGNVTFLANKRSDLQLVESGSVDLFYSRLVFQHMDPALMLAYLAELGRILTDGGIAAFQIPRSPAPRGRVRGVLRTLFRPFRDLPGLGPRMSMFFVPREVVERTLAANGLELVTTEEDHGARPMQSYLYIAARRT